MKQFLATGVVRSPHGVKGFVKVLSYSGKTDHFHKLKEVLLEKNGRTKTLEIECVRDLSGDVLVKFIGIDSPEDAKLISGWDILVPRQQASKLEKGQIYTADLIDMKLIYDNKEVGIVRFVSEGTQAPLMEVECLDGKNRIVPFLKGIFVDDVDIQNETMTLLKPELVK